MRPMLAMKSSTLSSLSVLVVTFLKASPAVLPAVGFGGCPCAASGPINPEALSHKTLSPAATTHCHEIFMVALPRCVNASLFADSFPLTVTAFLREEGFFDANASPADDVRRGSCAAAAGGGAVRTPAERLMERRLGHEQTGAPACPARDPLGR